jgi:ABC-2 type transport system ATP-binding protein
MHSRPTRKKLPMKCIIETKHLSKRYGQRLALNDISLSIEPQRVVGLIGQNGSGKTTLLDIIAGTVLPSEGTAQTLGTSAGALDESLLEQLGVVYQENRFLDWMSVEQHLRYFGSFYSKWDVARQNALLRDLELNPRAKVGHLSGGDIQKLGVITAVAHHPKLLLLDEPLSALDPIARETMLKFILRLLDEDDVTIIVSSHALRDIERLVNWVIFLKEGVLCANSTLDGLQERFAEWHVTSGSGSLPGIFLEPFIREQSGNSRQSLLLVEHAHTAIDSFCAKYGCEIRTTSISLERIYPLLVRSKQ